MEANRGIVGRENTHPRRFAPSGRWAVMSDGLEKKVSDLRSAVRGLRDDLHGDDYRPGVLSKVKQVRDQVDHIEGDIRALQKMVAQVNVKEIAKNTEFRERATFFARSMGKLLAVVGALAGTAYTLYQLLQNLVGGG